MSPSLNNNTTLAHREACDECHSRKVRCISDGKACQNCVSGRQRCIFSPRNPPGRPQKRTKPATNSLPVRVPIQTANSTPACSMTSTTASWQMQPAPSPTSLESSLSFFGGPISAPNSSLILATGASNLEECPTYLNSKGSSLNEMDIAATYPASDERPEFQYRSGSGSQSRSGGSSQNGSESDTRSQVDDNIIKLNQIQQEVQSQSQLLRQSEFGMNLSPTSTYNFISTFTQLSKLLFDLRRDRNSLLQQQQASMALQTSLVPLQQIFQRVSTFIEVSKTATNYLDTMTSKGSTSEIQSLTHLSLMVISITVDIYLSLAHAGIFSENLSANCATPGMSFADKTAFPDTWTSPNASRQQDYMNTSVPQGGFPPLTVVLNLTIMDFHMAQFQGLVLQMFNYLMAADQSASEELQKTQAQTSQVRTQLQSLINSIMSGEVPW